MAFLGFFKKSNDISLSIETCLPQFWSIVLFTGPCFLWEALFRLFCHWGNWLDSSAYWQTVAFVFTVLDHWARRGREKVYSLLSPVRLFSLCGILLATSCMEPFQKRGCLRFGKRHRLVLHISRHSVYQTDANSSRCLFVLFAVRRTPNVTDFHKTYLRG